MSRPDPAAAMNGVGTGHNATRVVVGYNMAIKRVCT